MRRDGFAKCLAMFCCFSAIFATAKTSAQIASVSVRAQLPAMLSESSGAVFFNGRFISHNDSGNENKLYELDTATGLILRTVHIQNAVNSDWEDLAQDATSLYIGDIGNNRGNRTDLKIYKIAKADYLASDTVWPRSSISAMPIRSISLRT